MRSVDRGRPRSWCGCASRIPYRAIFALLFILLIFLLVPRAGAESEPSAGSEPETVIGLGWLQQAELDPSGQFLTTCSDAYIHVWHPNGTLTLAKPAEPGKPWAGLSWSPHSSTIAVADWRGRILGDSFSVRYGLVGVRLYVFVSHVGFWVI